MSIYSIILLSVTIVASTSVVNAQSSNNPPKAILGYAPDFYKASSELYAGDKIVSPFTSWNALALILQAAKANTAQQITKVLEVKSTANIAKAMPTYYEFLNEDARSAEFTISNEIFALKGQKLKPEFRKTAINNFKAGIQKVDFTEEKSGYAGWPAADIINNFVKEKTNNTIQDIVRPIGSYFSADTRAVLTNSAHFSGEWAVPFDPINTFWGNFNGLPHPFMKTMNVFNIAISLPDLGSAASAIELEFADSDYSLVILMSVDESLLQSYDWSKITDQMQRRYVDLTIPKFRSYLQGSLNSAATKMGIVDMFTKKANLKDLFIGHEPLNGFLLQHSSSARVTEEHLEFASGTSIQINTFVKAADATCEPVIEYNVDRPFIYFIRNRNDDTILFSGHLVRPVLG